MHDPRTEASQDPPDTRIQAEVMPFAFLQSDHRHVVPSEAIPEVGEIRQAHDGMPIPLGRHVVDQIDQSILQAPDPQPMDHMNHQRRIPIFGMCCHGRAIHSVGTSHAMGTRT